jgi:flagellar protein FlbT
MPLKIELKPHERIIIGEALITNDNERTKLYIEGSAPILREKFILREKDANTPCKRIYYIVQEMYLAKNPIELHKPYFELIKDLQEAAPSLMPYIFEMNEVILCGEYYEAIKIANRLIKREGELFGEALSGKKSFKEEDKK